MNFEITNIYRNPTESPDVYTLGKWGRVVTWGRFRRRPSLIRFLTDSDDGERETRRNLRTRSIYIPKKCTYRLFHQLGRGGLCFRGLQSVSVAQQSEFLISLSAMFVRFHPVYREPSLMADKLTHSAWRYLRILTIEVNVWHTDTQ